MNDILKVIIFYKYSEFKPKLYIYVYDLNKNKFVKLYKNKNECIDANKIYTLINNLLYNKKFITVYYKYNGKKDCKKILKSIKNKK